MIRVLVTDADKKSGLAAIRTLGRHRFEVYAGASRKLARGFWSTYCCKTVRYPDPGEEQDAFLAFVRNFVRRADLDVVLPIGGTTHRVLSRHLASLRGLVALPLADWESMEIASSKRLTMSCAAETGVDIPQTYAGREAVDRYPVVVKASLGAGNVRYVSNRGQLESLQLNDHVIQEWIPGDGYGFFALFERGRERLTFMHRRIREYPVTGGASTVAQSIYDPQLESAGLDLLRTLSWHGVAMVEFKKDVRDGRYKLMEINPKFWGSLDLSVAAGVDFPTAAVLMALGRLDQRSHSAEGSPPYRTGLRFQWVFDDLVHVAARPRDAGLYVRDLRDPSVQNDLCRDDVGPALFDAARTCAVILTRATRRELRRPHGSVEGWRP